MFNTKTVCVYNLKTEKNFQWDIHVYGQISLYMKTSI